MERAAKGQSSYFHRVRSRNSQIIVLLALLALASFLVFWLHQEYEREVRTRVLSAHLDIAAGIISDQDSSLSTLISEVERLEGNHSVDITVGVLDEELAALDKPGRMSTRTVREIKFAEVDSAQSDTFFQRAVTITDDITDSLTAVIMSDLPKKGGMSEVARSTVPIIVIWPQLLVALLLFTLFVIGFLMLQRSHRRTQDLAAERNGLIANLAHELKTPISTVSVALEAVQDFHLKKDFERSDRYLSTARSELGRLSESVDTVLTLSKADQDALIYAKERVELDPLIGELIEIMGPQAELRRIGLSCKAGSQAVINADRSHLRNAFLNLIDNAIKYGREGGKVHIEVDIDERLRITFQDDGVGVPERYRSRIFDRFFRVEDLRAHNVKGHGLGLSYAKEVIHAHGGELIYEPGDPIGSSFHVLLPLIDG